MFPGKNLGLVAGEPGVLRQAQDLAHLVGRLAPRQLRRSWPESMNMEYGEKNRFLSWFCLANCR